MALRTVPKVVLSCETPLCSILIRSTASSLSSSVSHLVDSGDVGKVKKKTREKNAVMTPSKTKIYRRHRNIISSVSLKRESGDLPFAMCGGR
jgi:hypothetical protein